MFTFSVLHQKYYFWKYKSNIFEIFITFCSISLILVIVAIFGFGKLVNIPEDVLALQSVNIL